MKLKYIHIKMNTASGMVEDFFRANVLGETVARQRAAMRVEVMKSSGARVVAYTEYFEDGTKKEIDS